MSDLCSWSNALYSHSFDDGTKLELKQHIQDVTNIALRIVANKVLNFSLSKETIEDIVFIISTCHDFGKSTEYFQRERLETNTQSSYTKHALLSALAGFITTQNYIEQREDRLNGDWHSFMPLMVFYIIAHHHVSLGDMAASIYRPEGEAQILQKQIEKIDNSKISNYIFTHKGISINFTDIKECLVKNIRTITEELKEHFYNLPNLHLEQIFLLYFLFSVLMEADKSRLILGEMENSEPIEIDADLVSEYKKTTKFEGSEKIKQLRDRAYSEITDKVQTLNLQHKIYSITLPTGLGKTLASLSFALKLRERIRKETGGLVVPKIVYSLPFLSIIDQTEKVFNDVFKEVIGKYGSRILLKDHSLSDVIYRIDGEELDANKSEFLIASWDAEIVLTTVDRLFYSFFSPAREYIMKFHNLFNAIIILDEIQSINDEIWLIAKEFFSYLSKIGNSYIILMTATQPVIFDKTEIKEIIGSPESYYKELNRVILHPFIEKEISLREFSNAVIDYVSNNYKDDVMVVLNTIDSSIRLYKTIKERFKNKKVIYLSSNIIPKERLRRIEEIKTKSKNGKIIVTTQCVEAGVDIDVDVVFRDFAPLDSINQVAGRCNRHDLRDKGKVFIYKIVDENSFKSKLFYSYIYGEVHTNITKEVINNSELTEDMIFSVNKNYFNKLKKHHFETREIIDEMLKCEFSRTEKFCKILREDDILKESVFVELDKESKRVFIQFVDALQTQNWKERRNKLLRIRKGLSENTISLYKVGKREGEKYLLSEFVEERFGIFCLDRKHYDKQVGFLPKNRSIIL